MPESPRADKTFLVFAPLWRMPRLGECQQTFYYMSVVDAPLRVYPCSSVEDVLSVHVTHKRCVRIQGVFTNGLREN